MANISRASFSGDPFPHDVVSQILNVGLAGAPVFDSLTRRTTSRGSLVFATGDPSGFGWVSELGEIPSVDPGDDSAVVSVTKLAGLLLLGNEAIGDSELNLTNEVGRLIRESMAAKADVDLLYGVTTPAPEAPVGVFGDLDVVDAITLRAAVLDACAAIMGAGGAPNTVLLSPALWSAEMTRREAQAATSGPLFSDLGLPLTVRVASTLKPTDALVLDNTGCFGIVRNDYSIEASGTSGDAWTHDGVSLRIKARLAMAIPSPSKHARALTVTPAVEPPAGP